jgi:hypothetical protein
MTTGAQNFFRGLVTYGLAIPIALIIGYLLASRSDAGSYLDWSTWGPIFVVLLFIALPLALKWHHPILILSWNTGISVAFLPGRPELWLGMAFLSLIISLGQRTLVKDVEAVSVPSVLWPVLFLTAVILVTARFTGGFGLNIFGSQVVGGRAYFVLLASAAGFIALIAQRIPQEKAMLYLGLFMLGALFNAVSSLAPYGGPELYFLYFFFPPDAWMAQTGNNIFTGENIQRFYGLTVAALGVFYYLLARHGITGVFAKGRIHRPLLLLAALLLAMAGGYRSFFVLPVLTLLVLFWFEGISRQRLGVALIALTVIGSTLLVPFADKLPLAIQRSLTVLPLKLDAGVRMDAEYSSEWRLAMWRVVWPQVPDYLWFGKGLGIGGLDLSLTEELVRRGGMSSQEQAMLTGNYHNGALSVLIPFGIWGALGWVWFLIASIRALYLNYRHGPESLNTINTFLLAYFVARTLFFFSVFGDIRNDLAVFAGIIGLGLALNGGIHKRSVVVPAVAPEPAAGKIRPTFRPAPAFSR